MSVRLARQHGADPAATPTRGDRVQAAGVLVFLTGAAAAVTMRDPHVPGSFGVCPSLLLFGVYCPGCGALRGLHDLVHADIAGAFTHNVLLVPATLLLVAWAASRLLPLPLPLHRARSSMQALQRRVNVPTLVGVVLVGFAVLRNLPGSPLAP